MIRQLVLVLFNGPTLIFMNYTYFLLSFFLALNLNAQLRLPKPLHDRLEQLDADIFRPLDAGYKAIPITGEDYVPAQFAIYSKE